MTKGVAVKKKWLLLLLFLSIPAANAADVPDAYSTAIKLFHLGEQKKAFSVADELINKENTKPRGYRLRAELNHEQGRDDLAKKDTDKCIEIAVNLFQLDSPSAASNGAMPVKSISEITAKTRMIDQSFSQALSDADKKLAQPKPKLDLAQIQQAIAKDPRDFVAVFKEAVAYHQTGDWKAALKAFGKALTLQAKLAR